MMRRNLLAPFLASGLAIASGACGSSKGTPGPGGDASDGPTASGGTTSASGGSTGSGGSGGSVAPGDDFADDFSVPASGGAAAVIQNGGHRPLTADEVAALTSAECSQFDAPVEPLAPVIELVVDVSFSMRLDVNGCEVDGPTQGVDTCPTEGSGLPTKWDLFLPAILSALDGIPDGAFVGMQQFPTARVGGGGGNPGGPGGTSNCASEAGRVPIAELGPVGSPQRTALTDRLNNARLEAGTPTHDALASGKAELDAWTDPGKKFLLLITDGEPTVNLGCTSPTGGNPPEDPADIPQFTDPIVAAVEGYAAEGVGTFVVGSPGSEISQSTPPQDMRPFLSKVAQVGGTGPEGCLVDAAPFCHFDTTSSPDFAEALKEGLRKITELVNDPCVLQVPPPPNGQTLDKAQTSVILSSQATGSTLIFRDDSPEDCTQGWTWTGDTTIELCPASCEQVKADVGAEVNASFGCETIYN
jgi:hypothetical protein